MVKNKDLQSFLEEHYGGDPSRVERIEITSDEFSLSEEPNVNVVTEGRTFWQLDDISKENMPNLRELCLVDEPIFGSVEVADLDFCLVAECQKVKLTIRGITYDIRTWKQAAWIYEFKDNKVTITRE